MQDHRQFCNHCTRQGGVSSIHDVDLVLFDLDGLLVDSEVFHWQAYQCMMEQVGCILPWDYATYLHIAGSSSHGIRDRLKKEFPDLFARYTWNEMYAVKKEQLHVLLDEYPIPLMPGVEESLRYVAQQKKRMVVVTHSSNRFVEKVLRSHEIFSLIDRWVYREMYVDPKPSPDCYNVACALYEVPPQRTIGFEDSWRGIEALVAAGCQAVLVNGHDDALRKKCEDRSIFVLSTLCIKDLG